MEVQLGEPFAKNTMEIHGNMIFATLSYAVVFKLKVQNGAPCAPQSTPTNEQSKNARYDLQCYVIIKYGLNEIKQFLE